MASFKLKMQPKQDNGGSKEENYVGETNDQGIASNLEDVSIEDEKAIQQEISKHDKDDDNTIALAAKITESKTGRSKPYKITKPGRGRVIIINNDQFERRKPREGSAQDKDALVDFFSMTLKIEDDMLTVYENLTADDMYRFIEKASEENYENIDFFVCIIMSHGDSKMVGASDHPVYIEELCGNFTRNACNEYLRGKPKLFFIQACQGQKEDVGVSQTSEEENDAEDEGYQFRLPNGADLFIAYSVVQGFMAYRHHQKGSRFIQSMVNVFKENWKNLDLLTMMTEVNYEVAKMHQEHEAPKDPKDPKKAKEKYKLQMPYFVSTLRKLFYFGQRE